jgi:hypothetical protein
VATFDTSSRYPTQIALLLPPSDADFFQNIIHAYAWSAWHGLGPNFEREPIPLGQNTPVWAVVGLEPLEVVHLIPLVLLGVLLAR